MPEPSDLEQLLRLFEADGNSELLWNVGADGDLRFFVDCSDTFWWATADGEPVDLPVDLPSLKATRAEAIAVEGLLFWGILWVARKRGVRPMRRLIDGLATTRPALAGLLEAAGPERDPKSEG